MHTYSREPRDETCYSGQRSSSDSRSRDLLHVLPTLLVSATLCAAATDASNFEVQPARVELTEPQAVGIIKLRNLSAEEALIHTEASKWLQTDGRSQHLDTDDLVLAPPIFTLAPGAEQIVRVKLQRQIDSSVEATYRIFLTEVPRPRRSGESELAMNLRLAIPVFVSPSRVVEPSDLEWQLEPAGRWLKLSLTNTGNTHIQVKGIDLSEAATDKLIGSARRLGYLLAGQRRVWTMRPADAAALSRKTLPRIMVSALTNHGRQVTEASYVQ